MGDNLKDQFIKPLRKAKMKDNVMAFLDIHFKISDTDSSADKNTVKKARYEWDEILVFIKKTLISLASQLVLINIFALYGNLTIISLTTSTKLLIFTSISKKSRPLY